MNTKSFFALLICGFLVFCSVLVVQSGLFDNPDSDQRPFIRLSNTTEPKSDDKVEEAKTPTMEQVSVAEDFAPELIHAKSQSYHIIGSDDKDSDFKFKLELTTTGAAIARATLSEYDDRNQEDPKPLVLLSPIETDHGNVYSMANKNLDLLDIKRRYSLETINWKAGGIEKNILDGSEQITFEVSLGKTSTESGSNVVIEEVLRITKTYTVKPDSYEIGIDLKIENLSGKEIETRFGIQGPAGINREDARTDSRNITTAFITRKGEIGSVKKPGEKLRSYIRKRNTDKMSLQHKEAGPEFLWAAITNKYFAAILRPVSSNNTAVIEGLRLGLGEYYDPELNDISAKRSDGNEDISFSIRSGDIKLSSAESGSNVLDLNMAVYIGPKDNKIFKNNETYTKLGFFHTINFRACCACLEPIIRPLAFGIMWVMNMLYVVVPNYGVVIIILVFLVRLIMHPITKKSQVSMMKLQKVGPIMEEIKKKYANNPTELRKKSAEAYREAGANPVMGILPMFIQMPIWISLWTAVNISIDIRGQAFLPFWITDLASPDALISFKAFTIPLLGWEIDSLNLLPLLMGVVMFLQQKLMPHNSAAQTNPQMAQQQKMMMIMMPLMFPIMLYKGPSGVNLYILSSITAGVIEQMVIRKHIREKEELESHGLVAVTSKTGGKVKKKKPKPFYKS